MKAYKGFDKNMHSNGYQFSEGETYVHDGPLSLCESGFHACQDPIDCMAYYDPCDSVYHAVEADGVSDERGDDTKIVCKKIKIGARIGIAEMVKASIGFAFASCKSAKNIGSSRMLASRQAARGDFSRQSASGHASRQAAEGYASRQSASGNESRQAASGYGSRQAASGDYSIQAASGNYNSQAVSGDGSRQAASGDGSRQAASGHSSCQETTGKNCVMMSAGNNGKARGKIGSWIVLTEWTDGVPDVVAMRIDGQKIKEDTWYMAKDGKLVEAE